MRKLPTNFRLTQENIDFIELLADELEISKSKALDLIISATSNQMGVALVIQHYNNGYTIRDGRYKDGTV